MKIIPPPPSCFRFEGLGRAACASSVRPWWLWFWIFCSESADSFIRHFFKHSLAFRAIRTINHHQPNLNGYLLWCNFENPPMIQWDKCFTHTSWMNETQKGTKKNEWILNRRDARRSVDRTRSTAAAISRCWNRILVLHRWWIGKPLHLACEAGKKWFGCLEELYNAYTNAVVVAEDAGRNWMPLALIRDGGVQDYPYNDGHDFDHDDNFSDSEEIECDVLETSHLAQSSECSIPSFGVRRFIRLIQWGARWGLMMQRRKPKRKEG